MLRRYLLITTTLLFCFASLNASDQKPTVPPSPQKVNQRPTPPRPPTSRNQKTFFGFNDQKTTLWCERWNAGASATLAATMGAGAAVIHIPPAAPFVGPVLVAGGVTLMVTSPMSFYCTMRSPTPVDSMDEKTKESYLYAQDIKHTAIEVGQGAMMAAEMAGSAVRGYEYVTGKSLFPESNSGSKQYASSSDAQTEHAAREELAAQVEMEALKKQMETPKKQNKPAVIPQTRAVTKQVIKFPPEHTQQPKSVLEDLYSRFGPDFHNDPHRGRVLVPVGGPALSGPGDKKIEPLSPKEFPRTHHPVNNVEIPQALHADLIIPIGLEIVEHLVGGMVLIRMPGTPDKFEIEEARIKLNEAKIAALKAKPELNPKLDAVSPEIPKEVKQTDQTQIAQESKKVFSKISNGSLMTGNLKTDEKILNKESATLGAAIGITKKPNLIQFFDAEKVPQLLSPEANKVVAPKAEMPSVQTHNTQKIVGVSKPVETSTLGQSTENDAAFIAPTCSLPAPNFGQSAQPSDYSVGMKGSQFTVQVPLSKDMNGSVSANPLEMGQLVVDVGTEAWQWISHSGKYNPEVQRQNKKQETQQEFKAQLDVSTKNMFIGGCPTMESYKMAQADILLVQREILRAKSELFGNNMNPERMAYNDLYMLNVDQYNEIYSQYAHWMQRSAEEDHNATMQALYAGREYAKTGVASSEKVRTRIVRNFDNRIRAHEQHAEEVNAYHAQENACLAQQNACQAVQAQAAVAIDQPVATSPAIVDTHAIHENAREAKKSSKEQKAKQEAKATTGSPNGGPKKDDRNPRKDAEDAANTIRGAKEALDELKKKIAKMPDKTNKQKMNHIFKDTPGHRAFSEELYNEMDILVQDVTNYKGLDQYGKQWFSKNLENGEQIWAVAQNGEVISGGINKIPRLYSQTTGL